MTESHYWDDSVYLQHAKMFLDGRDNYSEMHYRPPLMSFFLAFGFWLWDNPWMATIVSGFLGMLGILFMYMFSREYFDEEVGFWSAVLLGCSAFYIYFSHRVLTGVPALGLVCCSLWLYHVGLRKKEVYWLIGSGLVFSLAVLMRFTSAFVVLYFVIHWFISRHKFKDLVLVGASSFVGLLPYFIWQYNKFGDPVYVFRTARGIIQALPTAEWIYGLEWFTIFPAVMLLGLVLGVYNLKKKEWTLVVWGLLFYGYMHTIPHMEIRYLIPLGLVMFPLCAKGLLSLCKGSKGKTLFMGLIAFSLLIPALAVFDHPLVDTSVSDSMQASAYIAERASEDTTIYAVSRFPLLAYYSGVRTESLFTQDVGYFDRHFPRHMKFEGYYVHYAGDALPPTLEFLRSDEHFREAASFGEATVFEYKPQGFVSDDFSVEKRPGLMKVAFRMDSAGDVYREDGLGNIWKEEAFDELIATHVYYEAPVLLGVIPDSYSKLNAEKKEKMRLILLNDLFSLGQIGLEYVDFTSLSLEEQRLKIKSGKDMLSELGEVNVFIPPYNHGNDETVEAVKSEYGLYSSSPERDVSSGMLRLDIDMVMHNGAMKARSHSDIVNEYERYLKYHPWVVIGVQHFTFDDYVTYDNFLGYVNSTADIVSFEELSEWKKFVEGVSIEEKEGELWLTGEEGRELVINLKKDFSGVMKGNVYESVNRLVLKNTDISAHTLCLGECVVLEPNEEMVVKE